MGGSPKQYRLLLGVPILRRSVDAFLKFPECMAVQVVIGERQESDFEASMRQRVLRPPVLGGDTRQESVRRGLEALASVECEFVLIHDAARPLVSPRLIASILAALEQGADAAVPMLPVADSMRQMKGGVVGAPVSRDGIYRAQTPQGFVYDAIRRAHAKFAGSDATDDIVLAERAGMTVTAVAGEETNIKITNQGDLVLAERLLSGIMDFRTGSGFDVHRFVDGDHIWLCGVRVPHSNGLEGHSDADAGLHALTDAVLGALAAGDIGQHFSPSDPRWKNAPSRQFLAHAAELVRQRGGSISNCDVTIICEAPKIGPHREAMRNGIAEILDLDVSKVSVKATTTEGLGFTGRGEGLAAQATATIRLPS